MRFMVNGMKSFYLFCGFIIVATVIFAENIESLRISGENGDVDALLRIGENYEMGQDDVPDFVEAIKWYKKAASIRTIPFYCY